MTSPALAAVGTLRRIAAALEAGRAPAAGDGAWLADRLRRYLESASRGANLDMCLGLAAMPGQPNWWTVETIAERDAALRDLAACFYRGRRPGTQAREIERLSLRYATASWRFDRERPDMPERYCGTETEHLWTAFRSGAVMPLSKRQLQRVLTEEKRADVA